MVGERVTPSTECSRARPARGEAKAPIIRPAPTFLRGVLSTLGGRFVRRDVRGLFARFASSVSSSTMLSPETDLRIGSDASRSLRTGVNGATLAIFTSPPALALLPLDMPELANT